MSTVVSHTLARLKVGIVGGMGVEATHTFSGYINSATKSLGYIGEEHIPSKVIDDSLKPDRTPFILKEPGAISPVTAIVDGCSYVHTAGASVIFIPCNTAHATSILDDVKKESPLPIISLIDLTLDYIKRNYAYAEHVGLLATDGTVESKQVYHTAFESADLSIVVPDKDVQRKVMDAIYNGRTGIKAGINRSTPFKKVKAGTHPSVIFRDAVINICNQPGFAGATNTILIIAGCTEVPLALLQSDVPDIMLIDPMKIAAIAAVKFAHDDLLKAYLSSEEYLSTPVERSKEIKEILEAHYKRILINSPITKYDMQGLEEQLASEHGHLDPIPLVTISQAAIAVHSRTNSIGTNSPPSENESSSGESVHSHESSKITNQEDIKNILAMHEYTISKGTSNVSRSGQNKEVLRIKFTNSKEPASIAATIIQGNNYAGLLNSYLIENLTTEEYGLKKFTDIRFHKNDNSITISDTTKVREFLSKNLEITEDKIKIEQKIHWK